MDRRTATICRVCMCLFLVTVIGRTPLSAEQRTIPEHTILAEYDGGTITKADFDEEFRKVPDMFRSKYATRRGRTRFLEDIVLSRLSYYEALELGIDKDPQTYSGHEDDLKPYFASVYHKTEITDQVDFAESQLQEYYHNNIDKFRVRSNTVIKYLQVENNSVRAVRNALRRSRNFEDILQRYSTHTFSKNNNGVIGNIRDNDFIPGIGQDEDLFAAIDNAPLNEWTGPVNTINGVHFFKVLERTLQSFRPFEEVKDDIDYLLSIRKKEHLKQQKVAELKENYGVNIDYNLLDTVNLLNLTPDAPILDEVVISGNIPGMKFTVEDLYEHFKTVSPYIVNDNLTSHLDYYGQVRHLSRDEWIELTTPAALQRLVNNIVEVNLFDHQARQELYEELDTDDPEISIMLSDPTSSRFDQQVFENKEVKQLRRHVILKTFFRRMVTDVVDPTPDDVEDYYNDNIDRFTTLEHRTVRLFLYQNKKDADRARSLAKEAIAITDPDMYDQVMRRIIVQSLYKDRVGLIPYVYKDMMHPVFGDDLKMYEVLWKTDIGTLSDVYQTKRGLYFFIEAIEHYQPHIYPLDHVERFINESLTNQNRTTRWNEVKQKLLEKYNVITYPERLFIIMPAEELFDLADQAKMRRRFNDAIHYYDLIIENHSNNEDDYRALFMKAFLLAQELGKTKEASNLFTKVIEEFPHSNLHDSARYMLDSLSE